MRGLRRDPKTHPFSTGMDAIERAEAAEAALATARQALTEIAAGLGYPTLYREVARRALAATDSDTA